VISVSHLVGTETVYNPNGEVIKLLNHPFMVEFTLGTLRGISIDVPYMVLCCDKPISHNDLRAHTVSPDGNGDLTKLESLIQLSDSSGREVFKPDKDNPNLASIYALMRHMKLPDRFFNRVFETLGVEPEVATIDEIQSIDDDDLQDAINDALDEYDESSESDSETTSESTTTVTEVTEVSLTFQKDELGGSPIEEPLQLPEQTPVVPNLVNDQVFHRLDEESEPGGFFWPPRPGLIFINSHLGDPKGLPLAQVVYDPGAGAPCLGSYTKWLQCHLDYGGVFGPSYLTCSVQPADPRPGVHPGLLGFPPDWGGPICDPNRSHGFNGGPHGGPPDTGDG